MHALQRQSKLDIMIFVLLEKITLDVKVKLNNKII
jgi:hypothetical protein